MALPQQLFCSCHPAAVLVCCVQVFLLLVSFAAVPWMLLPKPLILKKRHEASERQVGSHLQRDAEPAVAGL